MMGRLGKSQPCENFCCCLAFLSLHQQLPYHHGMIKRRPEKWAFRRRWGFLQDTKNSRSAFVRGNFLPSLRLLSHHSCLILIACLMSRASCICSVDLICHLPALPLSKRPRKRNVTAAVGNLFRYYSTKNRPSLPSFFEVDLGSLYICANWHQIATVCPRNDPDPAFCYIFELVLMF